MDKQSDFTVNNYLGCFSFILDVELAFGVNCRGDLKSNGKSLFLTEQLLESVENVLFYYF